MQKEKNVRCKYCKDGLMFNVTTRLAMAMGVLTLKCDLCGKMVAKKISEEVSNG